MTAGRTALAAVLALALALPAAAEPLRRLVPPDALAVVDGDTVRLEGRRLRLMDIDAPETHGAHCRAERRAGARAAARLAAILDGRAVLVVQAGRSDPYGRPLVRLALPEGDAGQILLAEGLALPWRPGAAAHAARVAHWCGP